MKVLIVGGYDFFSSAIIMRLKREKHNIYIICGRDDSAERPAHKADVEYRYNVCDSNAFHIVDDIKPDTIIFMGAYDSHYNWEYAKSSNDYLSALSNILGVAQTASVKGFIYLSSHQQQIEKNKSKKDICVITGENLCLNYGSYEDFGVSVLRMPDIYGIPESYDKYCGELTKAVSCALAGQPCLGVPKEIIPLFVSDAVEAIYKVIQAGHVEKDVYELSGGYTLDTSVLWGIVSKAYTEGLLSEVDYTDAYQSDSHSLEFNEEFSFKPFMIPGIGIEKVCKAFVENKWVEHIVGHQNSKKKEDKKFISLIKEFAVMALPYIENVILFILAGFAVAKGFPNAALLLTFYVVLASAIFDREQMFIATVMSILYYTLYNSIDYSLYRTVSEVSYIYTVLIIIISGVSVSFVKDKLRAMQKDKDFIIETISKEASGLTEMLNTSRDIKAELESRLLNQSDSLSKIYEIVSKLDAVETRKVFHGALKVVSDIMRSKDISIYMSTNNSSYFRNVASSTPKARESMPTSIKITDYEEMFTALSDENIFVNRKLDTKLPFMALAISTTNSSFNVVIMLWSINFKDLGLYHINLFLVLRMIITNSITRAYQYEIATEDQRYIENTSILRKEYFAEVLSDQKTMLSETGSPFQMLKISSEANDLSALNSMLIGSLRTTDYVGVFEDNSVVLILGGTSEADLPFVEKRLAGKGLTTECVTY